MKMAPALSILIVLSLILLMLSEIAALFPLYLPWQVTLSKQFGYILLILLFLIVCYTFTVLKFRVFILLAIAFAVSTISELLGTAYGFITGQQFYYTASYLGYKVLGLVPLSILLLWTIIIMLAYAITNLIDPANFFSLKNTLNVGSFAYVILLATLDGFLAMNLDMILDPVHVRYGAWVWPEGGAYFGIPISNFIAWFFVAFITTLIFRIYCLPRPFKQEVDIFFFAPVVGYAIVGVVEYGILSYMMGHAEYAIVGISVMFPFIAIAVLSYRLKKYKADFASIPRNIARDSHPIGREGADE
jgi:putative membrane protein